MSDYIKGLNQIYDENTGRTSVTWSYKDNPELEHFVLEYYDEIKKKWVPYDEHMGIVRKEDAASTPPKQPSVDTGGSGGTSQVGGEPGKDGKSVEYSWRGTELGIRLVGEDEYIYVDLKGDRGDDGPRGPRGYQGPKGEGINYKDLTPEEIASIEGPQGPQGEKGEKGDTGPAGPVGIKGETGKPGPKGEDAKVSKYTIEKALGHTIEASVRLSEKNELEYFDNEKWTTVRSTGGGGLLNLDGGKPSSEYGGLDYVSGGGVLDGS